MFRNKNLQEELQLRDEIEEAMKKLSNEINQDLHETLILPYSGMDEGECNEHAFCRIMMMCRLMEDEASRIRRSIENKLGKIDSDLLKNVMLHVRENERTKALSIY